MLRLTAIVTMALLSGCGMARIELPCPRIAAYSPAFQTAVADQLPTLPTESRRVIEDGGELRAALRGMGCR